MDFKIKLSNILEAVKSKNQGYFYEIIDKAYQTVRDGNKVILIKENIKNKQISDICEISTTNEVLKWEISLDRKYN